MTAALSAAILGLDVLLVEKAETVGGTTARSAGSVWVPNSRHDKTGQTPASRPCATCRARSAIGCDPTWPTRSWMRTAHGRFLEANSEVRFRAYAHHPDYSPGVGGSTTSGRVLEPLPFDARVLGRDFARLSPPLPEFMVLGGMMVDRTDIGHLLGATRSLASFSHAAGLVLRHGTDRLQHAGHAAGHGQCAGWSAVLFAGAAWRAGADSDHGGGAGRGGRQDRWRKAAGECRPAIVRSRRGVVLATGGLLAQPGAAATPDAGIGAYSPVAESATGDGVGLGTRGRWTSRRQPRQRMPSGRRSRCARGVTAARRCSRIWCSTAASRG